MKKYKVKFSVGGRDLKSEVPANSELEAINKLIDSIKIKKVKECEKEECSCDENENGSNLNDLYNALSYAFFGK